MSLFGPISTLSAASAAVETLPVSGDMDSENSAELPRSQPGPKTWKDPISALTHFAGFIAGLVGLVVLVVLSVGDTAKLISMSIYGSSLALLFLASSVYHFFDLGERGNMWLRRLDHTAIFLLIGGTYVPAFVYLLDGAWRSTMLILVAALTLAGVVSRLVWLGCPRAVYVTAYVGMGWLVVVPAPMMFARLDTAATTLLVVGGLFYTFGAVIYGLRRPNPWPGVFGFHEIWHLFVLAGAFTHYGFVYSLLDLPYAAF